jgi:hypothetical protein
MNESVAHLAQQIKTLQILAMEFVVGIGILLYLVYELGKRIHALEEKVSPSTEAEK